MHVARAAILGCSRVKIHRYSGHATKDVVNAIGWVLLHCCVRREVACRGSGAADDLVAARVELRHDSRERVVVGRFVISATIDEVLACTIISVRLRPIVGCTRIGAAAKRLDAALVGVSMRVVVEGRRRHAAKDAHDAVGRRLLLVVS